MTTVCIWVPRGPLKPKDDYILKSEAASNFNQILSSRMRNMTQIRFVFSWSKQRLVKFDKQEARHSPGLGRQLLSYKSRGSFFKLEWTIGPNWTACLQSLPVGNLFGAFASGELGNTGALRFSRWRDPFFLTLAPYLWFKSLAFGIGQGRLIYKKNNFLKLDLTHTFSEQIGKCVSKAFQWKFELQSYFAFGWKI